MGVSKSIRGVVDVTAFGDRAKLKAAIRAAAEAAQDCPILPTSESDAAPHFPEEPGDNLTPQQRLAVAAILGGATFAAAARAAGCGRRTLYAWRQQPAFAAAVERTSREALDVVTVRIRNLMLRATRVLGESMLDRPDAPGHAFRVLNSQRFWAAAQREAAPTPDDDITEVPEGGDAA